jgi:hypothetical protein
VPSIRGEVYVAPKESSRAPLAFAIGESLDLGLRAVKRDGVVLSLAQLVAALPGLGFAFGARRVFGNVPMLSWAYLEETLALTALGAIVSAVFRGGITKMSLDAVRGKKTELADLARGARFFLPMLAIEALQYLALAIGVPLLFVPYVLVWMGFALAPMWIVDRGDSLGASLRSSWRATRGERLHLFGFFAATAIVLYLGVLACCVGAFVAEALVAVATAHVYTRFAGEEIRPPDDEDEPSR